MTKFAAVPSDEESDYEHELERAIVEAEASDESGDEDAALSDGDGDGDSDEEDDGIRNPELLQQILKQIAYPKDMPWVETLSITHNKPIECDDAANDLEREVQL